MNIERTVRRDLEHARRQEQAIRCNNQGIRPRGNEASEHALVFQILRLKDIQAPSARQPLDCTLGSAQTPAGRPVRLRQYQRDVVASVKQRGQRARCELWSTGEY